MCETFGSRLLESRRVVVSGPGEAARGVAFSVAHQAVKRSKDAFVVFVTPRSEFDGETFTETPPLAVLPQRRRLSRRGGGHGDGPELDRIWFKFLDTADDLLWFLNNVQFFSKTPHPRPTLLVVDGLFQVDNHKLLLLLKLLDDAAGYLNAHVVLAYPDPTALETTLLSRYFPDRIHISTMTGNDPPMTTPVPSSQYRLQFFFSESSEAASRYRLDDYGTHFVLVDEDKEDDTAAILAAAAADDPSFNFFYS